MPSDNVMPALREFMRERERAQFHTPETVIRTKLETTRVKYPIERARGRSTKHHRL